MAEVRSAFFIKDCGVAAVAWLLTACLLGVFCVALTPGVDTSLSTSITLDVSVLLLTLITDLTEFGVSSSLPSFSLTTGEAGKAETPNCCATSAALTTAKFFLAEAFKADFKYGLAGLSSLFGVV